MNGAESLVRTMVKGGVDVCFTNPGTSEMHFVAALDKVDGMNCFLCLFEGVASGAADGYARMTGTPASTLLHLGPGLGNAVANLHNAKKANSPMVNIIGEHATYHIEYDAPLTADIEGIASPVSHWVKTSPDAKSVAADGAAAIAAANQPPGQISSLILPANTAWDEAVAVANTPAAPDRSKVDEKTVENAVAVLKSGAPTLLMMTGQALYEYGLDLAGRIASATGAKLMAQGSNQRLQRGAGIVPLNRVPYPVPQALDVLSPYEHIILIGAKPPIAFFAYPNQPSELHPEGCQIHRLAKLDEDMIDALERVADAVGAKEGSSETQKAFKPNMPKGALDPDTIAAVLGNLMPEGAIISDESVTTGRGFYPLTAGAPPHDWMNNMGGSIGLGMPLATGASVACPGRKVICLEGDGSGMYTLQALWTQARYDLDVTTIIFANRAYRILQGELANVGAENPGRKALDMLDLSRPDLDWVKLANGMGVEATQITDCEGLAKALTDGLATTSPYLIEVVL